LTRFASPAGASFADESRVIFGPVIEPDAFGATYLARARRLT